jgi:SM-20-related protein
MDIEFETIADGLAEHGYAVTDQFLSQSEVEAIRNTDDFNKGLDHFKKAGIGKSRDLQINEAIRGDYIHWLDKNSSSPAVKVYLDRLNLLMLHLNQSLYLSLKDFEVHMTIYPIGAHYKRHLDQFKHDDHRKLSVVCYLNTNWEERHGGQLRLFPEEKPIDILPLGGRFVCFRSDMIEHEVLPATCERLSLTGWILDRLSDLRHL